MTNAEALPLLQEQDPDQGQGPDQGPEPDQEQEPAPEPAPDQGPEQGPEPDSSKVGTGLQNKFKFAMVAYIITREDISVPFI